MVIRACSSIAKLIKKEFPKGFRKAYFACGWLGLGLVPEAMTVEPD